LLEDDETEAAAAEAAATASAKGPGLVAEFMADFKILMSHPVYVLTLLG
jgi:hypothetical protein